MQIAIQHMLDDKSVGGLAQADVQAYYDNLPVNRVCSYLVAKGWIRVS